MGKNFLLSKTLWVNVIAFVAVTFGISELENVELQNELIVGIMAGVNIVLRFMTKEPLKLGA